MEAQPNLRTRGDTSNIIFLAQPTLDEYGRIRYPKIYSLGSEEFYLLRRLCEEPDVNKIMAFQVGKSAQTIKNQLANIYQTFGRRRGSGHVEKIQLINFLIREGILRYEPEILEGETLIGRAGVEH